MERLLPFCLSLRHLIWLGGWQSYRTDEQETRLHEFLTTRQNPVVIEIGAGTAIPTVRRFGDGFAPRLIRINLREPTTPQGGIELGMTGMNGLDEIWRALCE